MEYRPNLGLFFCLIMAGFILGQKSETTQTFDEKGNRIPVTFIKTSPCYVVSVKKNEKDGYNALQIGFGKRHSVKKTLQGTLKKAGIETPLRFIKEFRFDQWTEQFQESTVTPGTQLKPAVFFQKGDVVKVTGTSKGKGFQGVVKRHGFAGGPRTHGQSDRERAPGSIGQTTTPGRVYRGKRMAGRMGGDTVTVRGLVITEVTDEGMYVTGLLPGARGSLMQVIKQ